MTDSEFLFVLEEKNGFNGLMEVWRLNGTDILDLHRKSAV
ncbi:hypothetical protein GWI34_24730 [Actinomadura sp. DSM 109109]|nr:hypothetical protein [Actinomadura lepetitiana]